ARRRRLRHPLLLPSRRTRSLRRFHRPRRRRRRRLPRPQPRRRPRRRRRRSRTRPIPATDRLAGTMRLRAVFLLFASIALFASRADAQMSEGEKKAAARAAYQEGVQLQDQGKPAEALARFEAAQGLYDAPTHLLHIAECQALTGKLVEAS